MSKKSVFLQIDARAVPNGLLMPSPRCWNPGLLRYRGALWLGYRYHRAETPGARCGIALCEVSAAEPLGASQRLELSDPTGTGHQEDCRLFMFGGEPHISYTDMTGYCPGVDYNCVVRFARLKLTGKKWSVVQEWQPAYGNNTGFSKEKNWVMFEHEREMFCVYATDPEHVVLRLRDGAVAEVWRTKGPAWPWGRIRGGTPPVDLGDGRMMAVFHSSLPTEVPPHFVRYYAAAYTFEKRPPFRVLEISTEPILAGSEEDGHGVDPRYSEGWKPFIPFPCGLVADGAGWLLSFGVNDWLSAVGRIDRSHLKLGAPDGSFVPRFFRTENATRPVRYVSADQRPVFIHWLPMVGRRGCAAPSGYTEAISAREAFELGEATGVSEVGGGEYLAAVARRSVAV